jgi:hypothetical protein
MILWMNWTAASIFRIIDYKPILAARQNNHLKEQEK